MTSNKIIAAAIEHTINAFVPDIDLAKRNTVNGWQFCGLGVIDEVKDYISATLEIKINRIIPDYDGRGGCPAYWFVTLPQGKGERWIKFCVPQSIRGVYDEAERLRMANASAA